MVARHAPSHVEASVAELAVSASVPQLSRVLSRYAFDPPTGQEPDPDGEAPPEPGSCLSWSRRWTTWVGRPRPRSCR